MSRRLRILASVAAALALAGCGATPPQAPLPQAKKLDSATGDMSTDCGLTYQVTAFAGNHQAELAQLEATASISARKLATVYGRNPAWIYQGETVHDIVRDSLAMLSACGLTKAESTLADATYARRR
jgi:hypothetical protein